MKILYCIASYSAKGGTEKVLSSKASYLAENGYEVTILISDQHQKALAYQISDKVKLVDLRITEKLKGKIKFIGFFQNIIILRKVYQQEIKKINPDIIIVLERGYEDFIIPYILKRIPKVREYHFSRMASRILESKLPTSKRYKKKLLRKVYEYHYKKYDKLVLLTKKDQQSWLGFHNTIVIPNVVEFSEDLSRERLTIRPKNIITVGSMADDRKGFSTLINIWSKIEQDFPEWSLNLYGDGNFRKNYEKMIQDLSLKHIILQGTSNHITEKYNESQLFVMTSNGEGLPMVIIEALSQGLPVVAYDCYCGPSDILVNNVGGVLVNFGDKDHFEEILRTLINDESLREEKSLEAYKAAKSYALEEIMPKWINLFNSLKA